MEETAPTTAELLTLANQAIMDGDKARAHQLASTILEIEPENMSALLIMAGVSDITDSLNYVKRALAVDPESPIAHEAMQWASKRLREAVNAAWAPEPAVPEKLAPPVISTPVLAAPVRKRVFATLLPWLLAGLAIVSYGLWSVGILDTNPQSEGRTKSLAFFVNLIQGKAAPIGEPTQVPTQTIKPTDTHVAPLVVVPSETMTATASDVPSPTFTATLTSTNTRTSTSTQTRTSTSTSTVTPTSTSTPTSTFTSTATNTPIPPTLTATMGTPTQAFDPTSGLPIIQITPLVYLTEEPDPSEYVEPIEDPDPIEYVSEPVLPVYNEPLGEKWIDVNLSEQMLYAYEGDTIVGAFLVSTGMADTPTVTGHYNVYVKIPYARMTGPGYDLADVPYTMYFYKGYGIHGTYWHSNFGTPMSHGCVNMETGQAGWLYDWAFVGIPVSVHY